jgi:hypothetical protein
MEPGFLERLRNLEGLARKLHDSKMYDKIGITRRRFFSRIIQVNKRFRQEAIGMKSKRFEKKLKLNKFTVATLTAYEQKRVRGGQPCPSNTYTLLCMASKNCVTQDDSVAETCGTDCAGTL